MDFYHCVYILFCAASATLSWSDNAFACACERKEVLQLQLEVRVVWHTGRQTEACTVPFFEGLVAVSVVTTATLHPLETLVTMTGARVVAVLLPSPSCVPSVLVCERHQMAGVTAWSYVMADILAALVSPSMYISTQWHTQNRTLA